MGVRIDPPRISGSTEERIAALERWARELTERVNVVLQSVEDEISALKKEVTGNGNQK